MAEYKPCAACFRRKEVTEFYTNGFYVTVSGESRTYLRANCKECERAMQLGRKQRKQQPRLPRGEDVSLRAPARVKRDLNNHPHLAPPDASALPRSNRVRAIRKVG